ncbi:DNA internalization-related competence protein ComEC/Rec2 [bacterium LRH843]|nr:DNA internalization-related competence protein ComEC/Rec2 [bacterium LRH843]
MQRILPLLPIAATLGLFPALRELGFLYGLTLILFFLFCYVHRLHYQKALIILPFIFLLYYGVGESAQSKLGSKHEQGPQTIYGVIQTVPNIDGDFFQMRVKSDQNEHIHVQTYLRSKKEQNMLRALSPGDVCELTGTLEEPSGPTNFAQFDYLQYLREQEQIYWILQLAENTFSCKSESTTAYFHLQRWRQKQMLKLEEYTKAELNGIMAALLFGERAMMDGDVLDAYERLGIIHLLAVSGLHVGIITSGLFYLLIRTGITRERAMELLMIFLPVYVVIAGAAPSVIRASCMSMIVLLCLRLYKKIPPLAGIIFVYMMYLLIQPFTLFHLGFQLSFLISFGLILSAPATLKRYTHPISQMLAVTILSQFLSLPILLYHVYEIPLLSIPINLVYIPFVTLCVLPLSILSFILSFFLPHFINLPLIFLEWTVPYAHHMLLVIAEKRWSALTTGKPHLLLMFCYYATIIYGCLCFEKGTRGWWGRPLSCFFLSLFVQLGAPYVDGRAKVTMLDVGQGDSYLIELPYRKGVYLIDTGGTVSYFDDERRERMRTFDVGANIVVPSLKERGIRSIDRLILTHGHIDHIGGAPAISKAIKIEQVLYGKGSIEGEAEREIVQDLLKKGAELKFAKEGVAWQQGNANFAILSPTGSEVELNARSIVLYAEIEGISFLFTGDLEEEGERRLLASYPHLQVDVLKVGHHGSRTSTSEPFLAQLSPKAAFISFGKNNHFGHPHPEVTERLSAHKVHEWRSDRGAVRLLLKKGQMKVEKALENEKDPP